MKLNSLTDLFQHEIKDLYSAEKQLVKALPKLAKAATNPELAAGFKEHLAETQEHVNRLEQISKDLGFSLGRHKCKAMEGLIEEGSELIQEEEAQDNVRDAGLIGAAQRVEHYEIAGYGTARTLALQLDLKAAADLLNLTLEEEKATDVKLSKLATNTVNVEAAEANEEEEDSSQE